MSIGLPEEETPFTTPVSPGNAGILVVDEDPAFQLGLKTFLREYVGFESVFTARSGTEALDILETEESIDVVTLDYQMPGMNGIEFLQELSRRNHRMLSVIMITGYPSDELEAEFQSYHSDYLLTSKFLTKPVEFDRLEPIILHSHEELLAARKAKETPPIEDPVDDSILVEAVEIEDPEDPLNEEFAKQSRKLGELEYEVKSLRGKWRGDFVFLLFIIGLLWVAGQFGAFNWLGGEWEKTKVDIESGMRERIESLKSATEETSEEEEEAPEAGVEPNAPELAPPPVDSGVGEPL
ncbi:MAG: hypothetical protein CMO55_19115 [Verrucomicrobiales bacterium]|nr:hypothetical protein [Verrucomicrobiales bacterium]